MLEFAGINIPFTREKHQLFRGSLSVRLGSPVDERAAKQAWINYSTPLWKRAGRSEAWIAQNIESEWISSKDDIIRRYLAGDFGAPPDIGITYRCPTCGEVFSSEAELVEHLKEAHKPYIPREEVRAPITRQVACPQCRSTLQIIPPSPELMVTQAFTWLTCPVCGDPELVRVPTGGFTVKIVSRQPWPPVPKFTPIIPPEEELPMPIMALITSIEDVMKFITTAPPTVDEGAARQAWVNYSTPLWRRAGRSVAWIAQNIVREWISSKDDIIRRYLAGNFEAPSPVTPIGVQQIKDALDQYEEKIIELEEALRTAQAAEFYNNPYGTIEAHAQILLNQFSANQPTVQWPLELSTKWSELFSKIQKLIIDARTADKERKPSSTYSEEVGTQQDEWITDTILRLQQQGLTWSSLPVSYLQPGQTAINGRAILPTEEGIPPTWETFTEFPVGIPDYSVEQKMQEASGQEPWELAEALPVVPPKKITPYLILAGLGVTTLGVWYYKKKKKKA